MQSDVVAPESSCDGRCCAVFAIRDGVDWSTVVDGQFIRDMLVPLEPEAARERAARFNVPEDEATARGGHSPHTCRHWDEQTRLCTVYEQRPGMCRDYPYEHACVHGCGYCAPEETRAKWRTIRARQLCKPIAEALRDYHYNFADEAGLQGGIQRALEEASVSAEREVSLAPRDRIDFLCGRVGIEVKVAGNAERALAQLERYAASPRIDALVLVTTRAWRELPDVVGGKPLEVVSFALSQAL